MYVSVIKVITLWIKASPLGEGLLKQVAIACLKSLESPSFIYSMVHVVAHHVLSYFREPMKRLQGISPEELVAIHSNTDELTAAAGVWEQGGGIVISCTYILHGKKMDRPYVRTELKKSPRKKRP